MEGRGGFWEALGAFWKGRVGPFGAFGSVGEHFTESKKYVSESCNEITGFEGVPWVPLKTLWGLW